MGGGGRWWHVPVNKMQRVCAVNFFNAFTGCIHSQARLGKSVAQPATPARCPSCLLRMFIRMEKRGSEPGGQEGRRRGSVEGGLSCSMGIRWTGVHRRGGGMSMSLSGFTAHSPSSWGILVRKERRHGVISSGNTTESNKDGKMGLKPIDYT